MGLVFLVLAPFIPYLITLIWRPKRIGARAVSLLLVIVLGFASLTSLIQSANAAPDVFYLRDTTTNGVASPAGQDINLLQGSSENTLTFDSVDDEAYWYTDVAYPTGSGDASIAAGSYTLNLYFSQLPQLPADWYNANWHCRKKITIDSGLVSADLSDFPVLISLASDADLAADAQDDGDDILFTSSDGTTQLSHEIETFDGGTGELVAWVQADLSGSTDTEIYMYYGNGTVSSQQDITGVWDGGFEGVWHIDETSGAHYDSTSNGNSSTSVDVATQGSATGQIDGADDFNGSSNDIVIADSASLDITSAITIEAWIEDDLTGKRRIVTKGDEVYVLRSDYTGRLQAYVAKGGTLYYARSLDGLIDTNGYHYVVLTWDGVTGDHSLRLYHNGFEISD
jgi:hypothetical protein